MDVAPKRANSPTVETFAESPAKKKQNQGPKKKITIKSSWKQVVHRPEDHILGTGGNHDKESGLILFLKNNSEIVADFPVGNGISFSKKIAKQKSVVEKVIQQVRFLARQKDENGTTLYF